MTDRGRYKKEKVCFFAKKKQKTFADCPLRLTATGKFGAARNR
jgi:hypothetical protein